MLVEANPAHPYSVVSRADPHAAVKIVDHALERFKSLTSYAYEGTLKRNAWVITSLGTIRPTCSGAVDSVARTHRRAERCNNDPYRVSRAG